MSSTPPDSMSVEDSLDDFEGGSSSEHDMPRAPPLAHEGHVYVDQDHKMRAWVVSHGLTGESRVLPGASWSDTVEATADDDGFMCVFGQEYPVTLVDEVLTDRLYIAPGGEVLLATSEGDGSVLMGRLKWLNQQVDFATLTFVLGPNRAEKSQEVVLFGRPAGGARVWFNILSLYDFAGFAFKVKYPSVWLHKHLSAWLDMMDRFGLSGHVRKSKPYDHSEVDDERILPFVTVSSFGLFALLGSWRHSPQRRCGMGSSANIAAVEGVLTALLEWMCVDEWQLLLFLDLHAQFRPPRPTQGSRPVLLSVSTSTGVDMTPMREVLASGSVGDDVKMAQWLVDRLETDQEVRLSELLHLAWTTEGHFFGQCLRRQLVWELGARMEFVLSRMRTGDHTNDRVVLTMNDCVGSSDYQLDLSLKRYVDSTAEALRGGMFHSFTVDKSRVGTLAIMNGAVVNEKNLAAWMVPQVVGLRGSSPVQRPRVSEPGP